MEFVDELIQRTIACCGGCWNNQDLEYRYVPATFRWKENCGKSNDINDPAIEFNNNVVNY